MDQSINSSEFEINLQRKAEQQMLRIANRSLLHDFRAQTCSTLGAQTNVFMLARVAVKAFTGARAKRTLRQWSVTGWTQGRH